MTRFSIEHGMSVRRVGSGPELVWIHGLGESSTSFDPVVGHPALAGFTHVLVDLPGYGRSAWTDAPTRLGALADHLAGWLRERPLAIVAGHSMGGVLATLIAERGAARAAIDIDGNLSRGDCTFSLMASAYALGEFHARGFATMRDAVYARGLDELPLRGYHAAMAFASPDVFHAHATDLVALSDVEDLAPRLAKVGCPHLFIAGVPDGICAYSRALLDQHHVRWVGIEPAGHWVYLDQLEQFGEQVGAFVTALP